MKKTALTMLFLIGLGALGIYGQTKNEDILTLLKMTGTDKLAEQVMDAMIPQFRQLVPEIPTAFWDRFREKLDVEDLLDACIPAYDRYYSHEEIKQLIEFYKTPLGKRVVEITPLLTQDTMAIGQKWGEKLGQDIVNELVKEGYVSI